MCVCVYMYVCMYVYVYIYIYIHTEGAKKIYTHFKRYLCKMCKHFFGTLCIYVYIYIYTYVKVGRDSSVGVATRYGLKGPGIESRSS